MMLGCGMSVLRSSFLFSTTEGFSEKRGEVSNGFFPDGLSAVTVTVTVVVFVIRPPVAVTVTV